MKAQDDATLGWSLRVLRIGGFIQVAFAAFWLIRGSLYLSGEGALLAAVVLGALSVAVFVYGINVTAGKALRPLGAAAFRLERWVTVATVLQLMASFIAPEYTIYIGHADWVLPSIAVTIGPLLLWLGWRLGLTGYVWVGGILTIGPVLLAMALSGTTLAVVTGLGAGAVLLSTAAAGFRQLGHVANPTALSLASLQTG